MEQSKKESIQTNSTNISPKGRSSNVTGVAPKTTQTTIPLRRMNQQLPNAGATLTLGILSLVFIWVPIVNLILSIATLSICGKGKRMYRYNRVPGLYSAKSYKQLSSGQTCATISLILIIIVMFFTIMKNI